MNLRVGPAWAEVTAFTPEEGPWLRQLLTVRAGHDWFTRDLRVCFLSMLKGVFPTGLLSYVADEAARAKRPLTVEWAPGATTLPLACPEVLADGYAFPNGAQLRDYQRATARATVAAGRAVVESATGSGKTPMMAATLAALGVPPSLLLVGRRSLVRQTTAEVGAWIGEEVGEVSAARRVLGHRCVVALVPSLAAHRDEPWARELLARPVLMLDECLDPATRVALPGGGDKPLGEVHVGDVVASALGVPTRVVQRWDTVRDELLDVTTLSGRRLRGSADHVVLGYSRGRCALPKLLPLADAAALALPLVGPCRQELPQDALAYLYGAYLGDGCLYSTGACLSLRFAARAAKGEFLHGMFLRLGLPVSRASNCRGDVLLRFPAAFVRDEFCARFRCVPGRKARTASLASLHGSPALADALMGLFDTDGWRAPTGSPGRVGLDTVSGQLADDVAAWLSANGMRVGRLTRTRKNPEHAPIYRVAVTGAASLLRFNTLLGFRAPWKRAEFTWGRRGPADCAMYPDPVVRRVAVPGRHPLVDIELEPDSSRLFIANGFAVHNCHHVNTAAGRAAGGGQWYELAQASTAANRYGFSATALKPGDTVQNWRLVGATGPRLQAGVSASALIESEYGARPYIYYATFSAARIPERHGYEVAVDRGLVNCIERNEAIVRATRALLTLDIKVLVLVEKLAHGRILEMMLRGCGAPVVLTSGEMGQLEQEQTLAWLREPGARAVVATRVISEGVNVPDLGGVVYARGGKSYVMLMQAVGRGMRPKGAAGVHGGACVIVDFIDDHNAYLKRHYEERRVMLAREPAFRVAAPGQTVEAFARAVLEGAAQVAAAPVEDDADQGRDAADAAGAAG